MTTLRAAPWHRPVSGVEMAWIVAHDLFPPFVNQMVLEGDGVLDPTAWSDAAARVAAANPGSVAVLRGWLGARRWVAEACLPVTRLDGTGWDGRGPHPALSRPLHAVHGPTSEVLLLDGPVPRVVLRTLHATTDGGGTIALMNELFRALRGEPLLGHADRSTDVALARTLTRDPIPPMADDATAATGLPDPAAPPGVTWQRRTLRTARSPVLPRLAVAISRFAETHTPGGVYLRYDIPADLRRQAPNLRSTANLTGMIRLRPAADATPDGIAEALRAALDAGEPARALLGTDFLRHVPLWLARLFARRSATRHLTTGRYGASAVLSNLGRLDLTPLHGAGFTARSVFFVPPGTPVTALFVGLVGHEGGIELTASCPENLASRGRLTELLDACVAALEGA